MGKNSRVGPPLPATPLSPPSLRPVPPPPPSLRVERGAESEGQVGEGGDGRGRAGEGTREVVGGRWPTHTPPPAHPTPPPEGEGGRGGRGRGLAGLGPCVLGLRSPLRPSAVRLLCVGSSSHTRCFTRSVAGFVGGGRGLPCWDSQLTCISHWVLSLATLKNPHLPLVWRVFCVVLCWFGGGCRPPPRTHPVCSCASVGPPAESPTPPVSSHTHPLFPPPLPVWGEGGREKGEREARSGGERGAVRGPPVRGHGVQCIGRCASVGNPCVVDVVCVCVLCVLCGGWDVLERTPPPHTPPRHTHTHTLAHAYCLSQVRTFVAGMNTSVTHAHPSGSGLV